MATGFDELRALAAAKRRRNTQKKPKEEEPERTEEEEGSPSTPVMEYSPPPQKWNDPERRQQHEKEEGFEYKWIKPRLMEHQEVGVEFMLKLQESNSGGVLLSDEMGLGKTLEMVALHERIRDRAGCNEGGPMIVIANKTVLESWKEQLSQNLRCVFQRDPRNLSMKRSEDQARVCFLDVGSRFDWRVLDQCDMVLGSYDGLRNAYKRLGVQEKPTQKNRKTVEGHCLTLRNSLKRFRAKHPGLVDELGVAQTPARPTLGMKDKGNENPYDYLYSRRFALGAFDEAHQLVNPESILAAAAMMVVFDFSVMSSATIYQNTVNDFYPIFLRCGLPNLPDWDGWQGMICEIKHANAQGHRTTEHFDVGVPFLPDEVACASIDPNNGQLHLENSDSETSQRKRVDRLKGTLMWWLSRYRIRRTKEDVGYKMPPMREEVYVARLSETEKELYAMFQGELEKSVEGYERERNKREQEKAMGVLQSRKGGRGAQKRARGSGGEGHTRNDDDDGEEEDPIDDFVDEEAYGEGNGHRGDENEGEEEDGTKKKKQQQPKAKRNQKSVGEAFESYVSSRSVASTRVVRKKAKLSFQPVSSGSRASSSRLTMTNEEEKLSGFAFEEGKDNDDMKRFLLSAREAALRMRQVADCASMIDPKSFDLEELGVESTKMKMLEKYIRTKVLDSLDDTESQGCRERVRTEVSKSGKLDAKDSLKPEEDPREVWWAESGLEEEGFSKTEKCVVFSSFVGALNVAEKKVRSMGLKCVVLHGQMNSEERSKVLKQFRDDETISVALLSIKAFCSGINELVVADRVVLLEPWWNRAIELQAMSRVHRHKQRRPVHVARFLIDGTFEEHVIGIGDGKHVEGKAMDNLDVHSLGLKSEARQATLGLMSVAGMKKYFMSKRKVRELGMGRRRGNLWEDEEEWEEEEGEGEQQGNAFEMNNEEAGIDPSSSTYSYAVSTFTGDKGLREAISRYFSSSEKSKRREPIVIAFDEELYAYKKELWSVVQEKEKRVREEQRNRVKEIYRACLVRLLFEECDPETNQSLYSVFYEPVMGVFCNLFTTYSEVSTSWAKRPFCYPIAATGKIYMRMVTPWNKGSLDKEDISDANLRTIFLKNDGEEGKLLLDCRGFPNGLEGFLGMVDDMVEAEIEHNHAGSLKNEGYSLGKWKETPGNKEVVSFYVNDVFNGFIELLESLGKEVSGRFVGWVDRMDGFDAMGIWDPAVDTKSLKIMGFDAAAKAVRNLSVRLAFGAHSKLQVMDKKLIERLCHDQVYGNNGVKLYTTAPHLYDCDSLEELGVIKPVFFEQNEVPNEEGEPTNTLTLSRTSSSSLHDDDWMLQ